MGRDPLSQFPILQIGSEGIEKKFVLNARQEKILELLRQNSQLSVHHVLSLLKFPASLRTVGADLSILKKLGLIEQQGKARSTAWKIK